MKKPPLKKITFSALLMLYVLSVGLIDLIDLPVFGKKIQLPELLFLFVIFPAFGLKFFQWPLHVKVKSIFQFNQVDKATLVFLVLILISTLKSSQLTSWLQLGGMIYLFVVMQLFKYFIIEADEILKNEKLVSQTFMYLGIYLSSAVLLGFIFWYSGIITMFVEPRSSYLYFGQVIRAQATAGGPNMLSSILLTCLVLSSPFVRPNERNKSSKILIWIALILTMAKTCLLAILEFIRHLKMMPSIKKTIAIIVIFFLIFLTHFYINIGTRPGPSVNNGGSFISLSPLAEIGIFSIYPTSYTVNKYASFQAFMEKPWWGIGLGMSEEFACQLQQKGQYPKYFSCLDSHCSYTGLLAETGIFGGIGLGILIVVLCLNLIKIRKYILESSLENGLLKSLLFMILLIGIEAWVVESYTFRHHWIIFGLFSGYVSRYQNKK